MILPFQISQDACGRDQSSLSTTASAVFAMASKARMILQRDGRCQCIQHMHLRNLGAKSTSLQRRFPRRCEQHHIHKVGDGRTRVIRDADNEGVIGPRNGQGVEQVFGAARRRDADDHILYGGE